jgi:hypothetical protein
MTGEDRIHLPGLAPTRAELGVLDLLSPLWSSEKDEKESAAVDNATVRRRRVPARGPMLHSEQDRHLCGDQ